MKTRVRSRRAQPPQKVKKSLLLMILVIMLMLITSVIIVAGGSAPNVVIDQPLTTPVSIPEPDSIALMGIGLLLLILRVRK